MAKADTKDPRQAVDQVREQISATRRERERLAEAPLSRDEVASRVDAWLTEQAGRARLDVLAADFAAPGRWEGNPFRVPVRRGDQSAADMGPILAALFGSTIRAAILDQLPENDNAVPMRDRPGLLAELDQRIRDLEADEERLIEQAEAEGVEIQRRPDASPEVILAVDWPKAANG